MQQLPTMLHWELMVHNVAFVCTGGGGLRQKIHFYLIPRLHSVTGIKEMMLNIENKSYRVKVLPKRLYLNGHIMGFRAQTQKLEQHVYTE